VAGNIKVTDQELQHLSGRITTVNDSMHTEVRNLERVMESAHASWRGEGANAYQTLQSEVNDDVRKLNAVLLQIKDAVDATRKDFSSSDAEQAAQLKAMQGHGGSKIAGL
jgi:WXG100 family type VII secretion target